MYINKNSSLWDHTTMRVDNAIKKATKNGVLDKNKFIKQMVVRLQKMTHKDKIYYAIEYLKELGYTDIVDIYEGRLVMDELMK